MEVVVVINTDEDGISIEIEEGKRNILEDLAEFPSNIHQHFIRLEKSTL